MAGLALSRGQYLDTGFHRCDDSWQVDFFNLKMAVEPGQTMSDYARNVVGTLFQRTVFKMLLAKGKITRELIAMLSTWKHSGFHVFCGNRISPNDATAMENLTCYIIRASFSQERMTYLDQEAKVVYTSKDDRTRKIFPTSECLANLGSPHTEQKRPDGEYHGFGITIRHFSSTGNHHLNSKPKIIDK